MVHETCHMLNPQSWLYVCCSVCMGVYVHHMIHKMFNICFVYLFLEGHFFLFFPARSLAICFEFLVCRVSKLMQASAPRFGILHCVYFECLMMLCCKLLFYQRFDMFFFLAF